MSPRPREIDPAVFLAYLSARQRQALIGTARGLATHEIAERLYASVRSIERDLAGAAKLFRAPNRTLLVLSAYRAGVVTEEHLEPLSVPPQRPGSRLRTEPDGMSVARNGQESQDVTGQRRSASGRAPGPGAR